MTDEERKKRDKKNYEFLKSRGICTRCGKDYAMVNATMCPECATKVNEWWIEHRKKPEVKAKASAYQKKRRMELLAKGLCVRCAKRPLAPGKSVCETCDKRRKAYNKRYQQQRMGRPRYSDMGLCSKCGKERVEGYRLCQYHLDLIRKAAKKGQEAQKAKREAKRKLKEEK